VAVHVTAVLDEPVTVAVKVSVPPGCKLEFLGETDTATTGVTVTMHESVLPPSCVVTVM